MRNKLKHIALIINILLVLFQLQSCTITKETSSTSISQTTFISAVVVNNTGLDGCGYMLRIGSENYEPNDLKDVFKVDNLNVWVKYKLEERASICMAGKTIVIIDCKLRD